MNKSEQYLAVFQRANALYLSSDSSSTDSAYNNVPQLLSTQTERQSHAAAVNKFFEEYIKQRHTDKDIKLLHGVWSNKEIEHVEIIKSYSNKLTINTYDDLCMNNEGSVRSNKNFHSSSLNENLRNQMYRFSLNNLKILPSQSSSSMIESHRQIDHNSLAHFHRSSLDSWENKDVNAIAPDFQNS